VLRERSPRRWASVARASTAPGRRRSRAKAISHCHWSGNSLGSARSLWFHALRSGGERSSARAGRAGLHRCRLQARYKPIRQVHAGSRSCADGAQGRQYRIAEVNYRSGAAVTRRRHLAPRRRRQRGRLTPAPWSPRVPPLVIDTEIAKALEVARASVYLYWRFASDYLLV
jgi:hypothetical protein